MSIRSLTAGSISTLLIFSAAVMGVGISPILATAAHPSAHCAGPALGSAKMFRNLPKYGLHAEEMLYERSRIGCIPVQANGKPKTNLVQNALRQQRQLGVASSVSGKARRDLAPAGTAWKAIGPAPIGTGGGADSGRILSMAWDGPLSMLIVGTGQGGVWTSTGDFSSWTTHTDGLPDLAIDSVAVDPSDMTGDTIYAGSGEQAPGYDALYGDGVYKSSDGGLTWTMTGAPAGGWGQATISKIVISGAGTVYTGVGTGFGGSGGVYISADKGATWTAGMVGSGRDSIADLAIDGSGNVYAADAAALGSQMDGGAYECSSPCTSSTAWTLIGGGTTGADNFPDSTQFYNMKITTVPITGAGGGTAVYAILSNSAAVAAGGGNPGHAAGGTILGVWRLLPGSTNWTQIASYSVSATYENQAWYDLYIWADPADSTGATVYFGLSDIYKSVNATATTPTWTNLTNVYSAPVGVHPDQHAIASDGAGTVFFGNDGGAFDSTNGGGAFNDINGDLNTLQFYGGSLGTSTAEGCATNCDPTAVMGGFQDNGTAQTTGGATSWTAVGTNFFGDGGYTAIDPTNNNYRYGENANGDIGYSTDGGASFADALVGNTCGASNFMTPIVIDGSTLYAGEGDLCAATTTNGVPGTWTDISSGKLPGQSGPIASIAVSHAGGTNALYVSDSSGHTYYTTDGGTTWTTMDTGAAGGPLAAFTRSIGPASSYAFGYEVTGLAADPTNKGVVYATVNGFQGSSANHVFKWTNSTLAGNGSWTDISGSLPDEPYDCVAINPQNSNYVYVGGITGAFETSDGGTTWSQLGTGLPNVQVDNLQISADGAHVYAFTHGRGAWENSAGPTAVRYAGLIKERSHGWTVIKWHSTTSVAGFNVYDGSHRLNTRLVTSRTSRYTFRTHRVIHHLHLAAVLR